MLSLHRIGTVKPKHANEIEFSRLGIGLEKLDRDLYDPRDAYAHIARLGVKWVRVQSGWARTEMSEGVYEFAWLDCIIDSLRALGLTPWLNLCYGNPVYTPMAARVFGAVGCPPVKTERERRGWAAYVRALTRHMGERVSLYEVWNEPDGEWCWKTGVNAEEYGAFVKATSEAILSENSAACVIGGAVCSVKYEFLARAFEAGMAGNIHAFSFHRYSVDERSAAAGIRALRAFVDEYDPAIKLIQGESGGQSSPLGAGALAGHAWDSIKQAKHLLRQRVVDLAEDLYFTSHFSGVDMAEALNGVTSDQESYKDYGYFGVLGARFDERGRSVGVYAPKPAYFALQNLAALLGDARALDGRAPVPRAVNAGETLPPVIVRAFERNQRRAICFWQPAPLMSETYEGAISLQNAGLRGALALVDPLDGAIYALPEGVVRLGERGERNIMNMPLTDAPLILVEAGYIDD